MNERWTDGNDEQKQKIRCAASARFYTRVLYDDDMPSRKVVTRARTDCGVG